MGWLIYRWALEIFFKLWIGELVYNLSFDMIVYDSKFMRKVFINASLNSLLIHYCDNSNIKIYLKSKQESNISARTSANIIRTIIKVRIIVNINKPIQQLFFLIIYEIVLFEIYCLLEEKPLIFFTYSSFRNTTN